MKMLIFGTIIISIIVGAGASLYIGGYMLDKSNNIGDFTGNVDTLSDSGIVYTNRCDHVKKKTPIDYYYPGCPFRINGR